MILETVLMEWTPPQLVEEFTWRYNIVARNALYRRNQRLTDYEVQTYEAEVAQIRQRYNYMTGRTL